MLTSEAVVSKVGAKRWMAINSWNPVNGSAYASGEIESRLQLHGRASGHSDVFGRMDCDPKLSRFQN